ncbi:hypothetical protein [Bacillus alkalicellulosilyticus]|uniref:hypothetical protein n=1 Tax=Alkalihalobacterium alkalicellulosilyticum TaxID=1912214 RepID=UPI00099876F5|nr:hypothetical protein [Bacillus alkalicellulosilyticus]
MSEITFLASSKPFIIPDEIKEYNNRTYFERIEDMIGLGVHEIDPYWKDLVNDLFTMPYIYTIYGADNKLFLLYLEKYMEEGEILELLEIPNEHAFEYYKSRILEDPNPIIINVGSLTYQNKTEKYQLNPKKWVDELSHKIFVTHYCVTTIVKY